MILFTKAKVELRYLEITVANMNYYHYNDSGETLLQKQFFKCSPMFK